MLHLHGDIALLTSWTLNLITVIQIQILLIHVQPASIIMAEVLSNLGGESNILGYHLFSFPCILFILFLEFDLFKLVSHLKKKEKKNRYLKINLCSFNPFPG